MDVNVHTGGSLQGSPWGLGLCPVLYPLECEQDTPFPEMARVPCFPFLLPNVSVLMSGGRKILISRIPPRPQSETDVPYDFECGTQDLGLVQAHSS